MKIETCYGTMEAEVWHGGLKHVFADPSGYNWRIDGKAELDHVRAAIQQGGTIRHDRTRVEIALLESGLLIIATDPMVYSKTVTVLTAKGAEQFLGVIESALSNPFGGFKDMYPEYTSE